MSSYNTRNNTRSSDTTTSSGTSKRTKKTETGGAGNNPKPNDTKSTTKQPSKVALKGSGSGRSTESALKKKEKMEGMTKQLQEEQKQLEKKLRYHKKALKVILEKSGKTGKTDNNIPVPTILQGAYEELEMEKNGMSCGTTAINQNPNILLPGSVNAMPQQTSPKKAKQVSRCAYDLTRRPSRMDGGKMGFTYGSKTTTNKANKTVNLNFSNANKVGYKFTEEHDYGLGKHNRQAAINLEPQMIELCNNHEWIASIPESRNRNTLVIAETPNEDEWPE